MDVLVAHPLKHHVFHLANGIQRGGLSAKLLVPLYRKGLLELVARLPGGAAKRAQGYTHSEFEISNVVSPWAWQLRRLLTPPANIVSFQESFDAYVARKLDSGELSPKILVTMQDYMPLTVRSAKNRGALIWSDQILNRSVASRERIRASLAQAGVVSEDPYLETANDEILGLADIVTAPSEYLLDGLRGRVRSDAVVHAVPYGVDGVQFVRERIESVGCIRVLARANDFRKGGHLLVGALAKSASQLIDLANGRLVEVIIVGAPPPALSRLIDQLPIGDRFRIEARVVPHVDMPGLMATCHLFVMPSLSEGMSLICVEAMQMGLPLVVSSFVGVDAFRHGEMGLCAAADVDSLASALVSAFENMDSWSAWGSNARVAAEELSWKRYEAQIAKIAKQLG